MIQWITLTPEKIAPYLGKEQLQFLRSCSASEDPLPAIIKAVTAHIRMEIAAREAHLLSENAAQLPEALEIPACHLVIEALQSRLPQLQLSKDQVRNAQNARQGLKRIAKGDISIDPTAVKKTSRVTTLQHRKATVARKTLKGL